MSNVTCGVCGQSSAPSQAFDIEGKIHCGKCADATVQAAKASAKKIHIIRYVDRSICARCNTYIGEPGSDVNPGEPRFCASCLALVQDWPYPQWLKFSLLGLLVLLVFSLLDGRKYFQAGKNLYRGEQLVENGQYEKALPYLKESLKIAPNSDKGALLTAKAALLIGDLPAAQAALQGHNGGSFEDADKPEFREVDALWKSAITATKYLDQADKLDRQGGHEEEAAKLTHQAAATFPQFPNMALLVNGADQGVAFARKDYDKYLSLAEKDWNTMQVAATASRMSSALACKYAIIGDPSYRQRSEEMLAKAKELSHGDKESLENLAEFEERNTYRLNSRKIITKFEYDQKFRSGANKSK